MDANNKHCVESGWVYKPEEPVVSAIKTRPGRGPLASFPMMKKTFFFLAAGK